jgi:hypothetical protein
MLAVRDDTVTRNGSLAQRLRDRGRKLGSDVDGEAVHDRFDEVWCEAGSGPLNC